MEVYLGPYDKKFIQQTIDVLLNSIHSQVNELSVRKVIVRNDREMLRMWITLSPDCYAFNDRLKLNMNRLLSVIR